MPGVSSPESVVRSIVWTARSSQAACQSFLTVRRFGRVSARRSTALRLTRTDATQSASNAQPGFRFAGGGFGAMGAVAYRSTTVTSSAA